MKFALILFSIFLISGCASTPNADPKDPYENFNRSVYKFNDAFDRNLLKPVAKGYDTVTPTIVRKMINNFFSNIEDVGITLNDLLQLKFKQAASDGSRVLFNTTFGLLGLINVTERLEKHNEDFGQTLGYWGVQSGPYLVLPFFGPSSIRDGVGLAGDSYTGVITNLQDVSTRNSLYVTDKVNLRANLLETEKTMDDASDRYAFMRDFYMARRQNLVYDGDPPREKYIDEED
ncbi:MAG: VacJ family lipoprotein [Gallionellaceae bacterium]|nr:VacJ family lipoprotein [Gallionellaceae bacterium]